MRKLVVVALVATAALGACKKKQTTPADDGEEHTAFVGPGSGPKFENDGEQIPPEKIDEANRLLERKQNTIARCLGIAVDNKELPKNSRGKITVAIVIAPNGRATAKVAEKTIESPSLEKCVIENVEKIEFPTMPHKFETSYTYAFEAV